MPTYSNTVSATQPRVSDQAKRVCTLSQVITVLAADLTLNALLNVGYVPAGARVIDVIMTVTDIDSATSCVLAVGDSGSAARFIQGSTAGQSATTVRAGNNATAAATFAAHTGYTAPTLLQVKVTTAPGTAVDGSIRVDVLYEVADGY